MAERLKPESFKWRRSNISSLAKKALRSEFFSASLELFNGNSNASTKGTHRKRGGWIPRPIATRFANITSTPI